MFSRLALALVFLAAPFAHAGVEAYSGSAGEKLFIEKAPSLGKDAYLVKFEGVESAWNDKIIRTTRRETHGGDRYSFEYELELSSGIKKRTWEMIVGAGYELINGSRVKKIELWIQESGSKAINLDYDRDLTKESQKIDLISKHKKAPFKPDVE